MADEALVEAAGRIADGEVVDWGSISSTLKSERDRAVADELAVLARIAAGHRQLHEILPLADETTPASLVPDRARWGHLDLLNIVGRGSYGTVYRAWDTRLERLVALKLFHGAQDPDAVMQEGRMLARVRHENVVTVYGADVFDKVAGLWMELIHGRTLDQIVKDKGPMDPLDAAQIGVDVARALEAVHAAGLLHCDIKAQNVVRESGGRVVLMDLGAGRAVPEARDSDQLSDVAGTPRYMAPELFRAGADATKATDIYSFGVLLYYLVSARFPVDGKSLGELKQAHLTGRSTPLKDARADVPAAYGNVVARALDRDPAKRQTSAADLQSALSPVVAPMPSRISPRSFGIWAAAVVAVALLAFTVLRPQLSPPAEIRSIAVMPIKNLTGDPSKDYVADGLTEVLISNLARVRSLRVPSFASVSSLRDSKVPQSEIASKLGVQLLLAGSITQADTKFRMAVHLVDPRTGTIIWGEEISREAPGVISAQAEVARMVAERLALTLSPDELKGLAQAAVDPGAQEAYLRGRSLAAAIPAHQTEAVAQFRKAVEIAPTFAPAWVELALAELFLMEQSTFGSRQQRADVIRQMIDRAISLDPTAGRAYAVRGTLEFYDDWNFKAAEQSFRHGFEVDPGDLLVRLRYAMLLAATGQMDAAIAMGTQAVDADPLVPQTAIVLGTLYYYARDYPRAITQMQRALDLNPRLLAGHVGLGRIYAAQGKYDDAIGELQKGWELTPYLALKGELARVYAEANRPADVVRMLAELTDAQRAGESFGPDSLAYLAAAEGDIDRAFRILDEAINVRPPSMLWLKVDPRVDPLRSDPRFKDVLTRMGLN